jgi:hypothetical protein
VLGYKCSSIIEDEDEYDDEDDILFSAFYSSSADFQYYTKHLTPETGHLFEATSE